MMKKSGGAKDLKMDNYNQLNTHLLASFRFYGVLLSLGCFLRLLKSCVLLSVLLFLISVCFV